MSRLSRSRFSKKGDYNKPHFAHYWSRSDQQQCDFRFNLLGCNSWQGLTTEARQQRLELFQEHFLQIIAFGRKEFSELIQEAKKEINIHSLTHFIENCCQWFNRNNKVLIQACFSLPTESNDFKVSFSRIVAGEAVGYLNSFQSRSVLTELIYYSLSQCVKDKYYWNSLESYVKPADVCQEIILFLIATPWATAISHVLYRNNSKVVNPRYQLAYEARKYIRIIGEPSKPFILCEIGEVRIILSEVILQLILTKGGRSKPISLATITNVSVESFPQKRIVVISWDYLEGKNLVHALNSTQTRKYLIEKINQHIEQRRHGKYRVISTHKSIDLESLKKSIFTPPKSTREERNLFLQLIEKEKKAFLRAYQQEREIGLNREISYFFQRRQGIFTFDYLRCPTCNEKKRKGDLIRHLVISHWQEQA